MAWEAQLVFHLDAPTMEVAAVVVEGALNQFNRSHRGVIQSVERGAWLTQEKRMQVSVIVKCASQSKMMSVNAELNRLFAEHQRANGINAEAPGTIVLAPGQKRWWQFWK